MIDEEKQLSVQIDLFVLADNLKQADLFAPYGNIFVKTKIEVIDK